MPNGATAFARIITAAMMVLISSAPAHADQPRRGFLQLSIDRAVAAGTSAPNIAAPDRSLSAQTASAPRSRSVGRKIAGAAVGAAGGFFGGGFLGAAIEGDRCDCDDPGLLGFIIGAPIGAAVGGILGWKFLF